jgi:hypothetical protein
MVEILTDSKRDRPSELSNEELLELRLASARLRLSSYKEVITLRFYEQGLVFRFSSIFVILYAAVAFVSLPILYSNVLDPADIIAQSFHGLFRTRLFIEIAFVMAVTISFFDGRAFKYLILSFGIVLSNYSFDMYYFYTAYLTQSGLAYQIIFYTRPLLFVALFLMYFNYKKS